MEQTALYSGLGSLGVALGYVLVKRLSKSRCASHSACCECDSPELTLDKQATERIDILIAELRKTATSGGLGNPTAQPVKGVSEV